MENFLMQEMPEEWLYYPNFLNQSDVRKAIHVGNTFYQDISNYSILVEDIPVSSTPTVENLLNQAHTNLSLNLVGEISKFWRDHSVIKFQS